MLDISCLELQHSGLHVWFLLIGYPSDVSLNPIKDSHDHWMFFNLQVYAKTMFIPQDSLTDIF